MMMIGTPGSILEGLFYQATAAGLVDKGGRPYSKTYDAPEKYWLDNPRDHGGGPRVRWSRHTWTRQENVKTQENLWEAALIEKADNDWADDHPTWQREYLGQWVAADDTFVYAYATLHLSKPDTVHWKPERSKVNTHGLPDWPGDWRFILGADLGYEDDFAFVVGAYSPHNSSLYFVEDFKASHLDLYQITDHLQYAWDKYGGFDAMVADAAGLGKLVVETINKRHGLPVQPAEKREKFDTIELLNADFHSGRVKLIPDSELAREMAALQFDLSKHSKKELVRTGKLRENPQMPNHLCDAALYAWRFSYHFWSVKPKDPVIVNSPKYWELKEQEWVDRVIAGRSSNASLWEGLRERSIDPLQHVRVPWKG